MIQIGKTLVSADCLDQYFCCDLPSCGGMCCIEGDDGAPLTPDEALKIEDALPHVLPLLSEKAKSIIRTQGVAYTDGEGDLVTSIVNGKDCVFSCRNKAGCCLCALEKAYENTPETIKPLSCRLYPIRITEYENYTALNYHRWDVCRGAIALGRQRNLPLYRFLKQPLISYFGKAWYDELEQTADELAAQGYLELPRQT